MSDTMNAIEITQPGGPDVLRLQRITIPRAEDGQILVKIVAAGVNRPDIMQRRGGYPPPPGAPATPGLEIAGVVAACGPHASKYQPGDKVCALVPGGGYAEYATVAEDNALPVPKGVSMMEAAAIPETFFTVWTNVFERGALKPGETLLVHGGSGGIGTTAIMLAKAFGARVIVTAGSGEKCAFCVKLGADRAVNYREEDFVDITKKETDGKGADVILDMVGGAYVAKNLSAAALNGRLVQIAFQQGSRAEVDLLPLMVKRLVLTGSTLRPRSVAEKASIADALRSQVWPLLAQGKCKPVLYRTFPLAEAAKAHTLMETSEHIGKIVLTT